MTDGDPTQRIIDGDIPVCVGLFGRPVIGEMPIQNDRGFSSVAALRDVNTKRMRIRQEVRQERPSYFILVPTLRCNIRCEYCQVSRVAEHAQGFDWSPELLDQISNFILETSGKEITLEFQGGEPLLRLDIIRELTERLSARGKICRTVICTNLQSVSPDAWDFFRQTDALISTSFDGTWEAHDKLRTQDQTRLREFRDNLEYALSEFGNERVSLVSTLDPNAPPPAREIIAASRELGITNLFLRPINYQGFARKMFRDAREGTGWDRYYLDFIDQLIADNLNRDRVIGEYYFGYVLRRVLDPRRSEHVDLRNPSWLGRDYLVINETGDIFPTDEARMLYRTRQVDLRIGHVDTGLDSNVVAQLNAHADNRRDPICAACVYQAACGRDLVDDLSRYGRIDSPRHETRHCQRHMAIFDHVMRKLARASTRELQVIGQMAGLNGIDARDYRRVHG